jgi:internalin A
MWYSLTSLAITEISALNLLRILNKETILSFSRFSRLQRLDLGGCSVDDELRILLQLQSLTHLNLGNTYIDSLAYISHLTRLHSLDLTHNLITDFEDLARLTNLTRLVLQYSDHLIDISPIAALTGLKELNLNFCTKLARSNIRGLTKLSRLENLSIQGRRNIKTELDLRKFSALRSLDIATCGLEDSNLLTALSSLTSLNLSNNFRINALLLDRLFVLSQLQSLTINNCFFSEAALPQISRLSNLTSLEMMQTSIGNNVVPALVQLPRLRRVNLIGTFVTQDKLQQLAAKLRVDVATPYFYY